MWLPETEEEIELACKQGTIEEGPALEVKREMLSNAKLAKYIAAMANDGGVVIFGIAEDKNDQPTVPTPIDLEGQTERLASLARTAVTPPVTVHPRAIRTGKDSSKGYIVLHVPLSAEAPHMVTRKNHNRYYGRTGDRNTRLTPGEVERLFERRRRLQESREAILDEAMRRTKEPDARSSYLYMAAKPLASDDGLLDRACRETQGGTSNQDYARFLTRLAEKGDKGHSLEVHVRKKFEGPVGVSQRLARTHRGVVLYMDENPKSSPARSDENALDLHIDHDGSAFLFRGIITFSHENEVMVKQGHIAYYTASFIHALHALYRKGGYTGPVDLGIAITGVKDATSGTEHRLLIPRTPVPRFSEPRYRRTTRAHAHSLEEDCQRLGYELTNRFYEDLTGKDGNDYFEPSTVSNNEYT